MSSGACSSAAWTSASPPAPADERRHHRATNAPSPVVPSEPRGRNGVRWWRRWRTFPWVGPCRDSANRRGTILLRRTGDGRLALIVPADGVAVLDFFVIGELRAALRDASFRLHQPADDSVHEVPVTRVTA